MSAYLTESFSSQLINIKEIVNHYDIYFAKISNIYEGIAPTGVKATTAAIKKIKTDINKLDKLTSKDLTAVDIISLFVSWKSLTNQLIIGAEFFSNHPLKISSNMSGTYVSEIKTLYTNAISSFEAYNTWYISNIQELSQLGLNILLSKYETASDAASGTRSNLSKKSYDTLEKILNTDDTFDMYVAFLNTLLNIKSKGYIELDLYKHILQRLEDLKNIVLQSEMSVNRKGRPSNTIQLLIQTYDLSPVCSSRPMKYILDIIGAGSGTPNFATLSKSMSTATKKIGFIVIRKITSNPIEFQSWPLTDANLIKNRNLMTEKTAGLNDRILERFDTIIDLKIKKTEIEERLLDLPVDDTNTRISEKNGGKVSKNIEIYNSTFSTGNTSSNYYYILETLDGDHYRLLTPWYHNDYKPVYTVPQEYVRGIESLGSGRSSTTSSSGTSAMDEYPSQRVQLYNQYIGKDIFNRYIGPILPPEQELIQSNQEQINADLVEIMMKNKEVQKELKAAKSQMQFNDFIHSTTLIDVFGSALIEVYSDEEIKQTALSSVIKNVEVDDAKITLEASITKLSLLNKISLRFKREIHDTYNMFIVDDDDGGKLSSAANRETAITDILTTVIETLITDNSNIYVNMVEKLSVVAQCLHDLQRFD